MRLRRRREQQFRKDVSKKGGRKAEHGRNSSGKREVNADGWLQVETYER
jgi:hypothetical protein